ncbi:MAG: nuclear transport factor 2 family protein [Gammaproteobacteria bacterium]
MRPLLSAVAVALFAGSATAQLPVEVHRKQAELLPSTDTQLATNKRLAFDYWREVIQAHNVNKASTYVGDAYVEHDVGSNGRDALVATVGRRPPLPVKATVDDLVSIVAERDLVVLAFRRVLPDLEHEGQTYTTTSFDMLRIAGGKIVEHWASSRDE